MEILGEAIPVVIAANALGEALGRDELAPVKAELERVLALDPADVVRELIEILDGGLRRVSVRPDVDGALIKERQVGEGVQPRETRMSPEGVSLK